jgi:hypothetical protein
MGVRLVVRKARQKANPSITGMFRSRTTKSGWNLAASDRASSPFAAVSTT